MAKQIQMRPKRIIVIGAGIDGLTAAHRGIDVLIKRGGDMTAMRESRVSPGASA